MQNEPSNGERPAADPRDIAPTQRNDVKHVVDTGLPPGATPNTRHGSGEA